ncbi:MAG: hypothetical protein RMI51_05045 [Aquificaceae bacterium]|nr:hypothetical protein [Aquificaceae bacterium]
MRIVNRFLEDEGLDLKLLFLPPRVLLTKYNPLENLEEVLDFVKSGIDFVEGVSETVGFMALLYKLSGKLLKVLKERGIKAVLIRRKGDEKEVIETEEVVEHNREGKA